MKQQTLNIYLQNKYGKKLYKLSVNAGFTCPNRDGKLGERGCIFCSGTGSGDFAGDPALSVTEQLKAGRSKIRSKLPRTAEYGYIAYFQAFTNTYAPIEKLRAVYEEALAFPGVEILSVATRPDCLDPDVLDLLSEMNAKKPVWVELGLQTIHEQTAAYIRRGYPLSVFDEAIRSLKARGIETIVHVILGLPGETREEMLQTVKYVGDSGADGIKLQLLHVLKGTDLADDYLSGRFECLTLEEYTELVKDALSLLPESIVIHRMTGDGDKKLLIAPEWSANKKLVLNRLQHML